MLSEHKQIARNCDKYLYKLVCVLNLHIWISEEELEHGLEVTHCRGYHVPRLLELERLEKDHGGSEGCQVVAGLPDQKGRV